MYQPLTYIRKYLIIVTLFIAFCAWSSLYIKLSGWGGLPAQYLGIVLGLFVIFNKNKIGPGEMTSVVNWSVITILMSFVSAFIDWNAKPHLFVFSFCSTYYGFFLYYILRIWKVSPKELLNIVVFFCIIWVAIEIGQQFTYPNYWFFGRDNEFGIIENRMGLWRYYIWGVDFVMLLAGIYIGKLVTSDNFSFKVFSYALIFSIGILCYCSRKHILAILVAIIFSIIKPKGKHKYALRLVVCFLIFCLIYNFYADYNEMNSSISDTQGSGEDFIRFLAADFFVNNFSDSPLYPIFGTGFGSVDLSSKLDRIKDFYKFYTADIGIIGYYSTVGWVGVSAIIYFYYKFIRNWKYIDLGYKLFALMKLMLIIFDFWMMWAVGITAYAVFLYLLDENIRKNKFLKYENRNIDIL